MATKFIGARFNINDVWGPQEHWITNSIVGQVDKKYAGQNNLVLNMTWLGPQFPDGPWKELQKLISSGETIDNLVWASIVDPLYINREQMTKVEKLLNAQNVLETGINLPGLYEFNTGAIACLEDFPSYTEDQVKLTEIKHLYLCYNRKPKAHRLEMVEKIIQNNLESLGVITMGYSTEQQQQYYEKTNNELYRTIDDPPEHYTFNGKFRLHKEFGNVPYDVCSLGRMDIWTTHFLNVVSETIAFPWDNTFVTEKTWKPIIGMRPFLINGQTPIYQWLRDRGFKTFNHYFDWVQIEDILESDVQNSIVAVIKQLATKPNSKLQELYNDMLPDLAHNRRRFTEFANEQKHKVIHLLDE